MAQATTTVDVDATELVIKPEFAMAKRSEVSNHEWIFNLESHITDVHQLEPQRDLFLVGYRDEERPNLLDERQRTSIPFFAVHALDKGIPEPRLLMLYNGDTKKEHLESLTAAPFTWKHVHTFPTGATVSVLQFVGRTTKRSSQTQSSISVGGQVFFPTSFDETENPGDDGFVFKIEDDNGNDDDRYFDSEVWDWTRHWFKKAFAESAFDGWVDCCYRSKNAELLDIALPPALDAFFKVNDDLDRDAVEDRVKKDLSDMFLRFKKKVIAHENHFLQLVKKGGVAAKDAIRFKIYPENEELRQYIKEGSKYISKCSGKASVVYPIYKN